MINSWGSLMKVSGGRLSSAESCWYLVEYIWHRETREAQNVDIGFDLI